MTERKSPADRQSEFYGARYADDERRKLRDMIFAQVYENYFGQSSWLSTADYDRFTEWLELNAECRLLDVACGSGEPSLRAAKRAGCLVIGVDSSAPAVAAGIKLAEQCGVSSRAQFRCLDAAQPLPFSDGSFDALACFDAVGQLRDREKVFADWTRVLKPAGRLVFTDQVLTGPISNVEVAERTPFGHFVFAPEGYNERLFDQARLHLVRRVDLTSTFVGIAERHCAVRAANEQALRSVEGNEEFERQSRYRAIGAVLARERRVSHFVYLAHKSS